MFRMFLLLTLLTQDVAESGGHARVSFHFRVNRSLRLESSTLLLLSGEGRP